MNTNLLKSYIVKHGETQESLADLLGIARGTINRKIQGKDADFTQGEIMAIKEHYDLSADEVDRIFFAKKVS